MNIVFFGTSSFAARVLAKLIENKLSVVAVVTRKDQPSGRNLHSRFPPVKETAQQLLSSVPLFQPEKASTPEFIQTLTAFSPDLFVVVAYGEIIKKDLLDVPRMGCINVHASLLPKYRGAAPIQRCLMDGEPKSGISIIEMTPKMDAGDVLAMEEIPVPLEMCFGELEPLLCDLGSKLLLKAIHQFATATIVKTPQNHELATFAPKILPEDEKINWNHTCIDIHNQIRALSPAPGAWTTLIVGSETKRLKIKKSFPLPEKSGSVGTFLSFNNEGWIIACGQGAIQLHEVQLEGKKAISASEFIRGMRQPLFIQI